MIDTRSSLVVVAEIAKQQLRLTWRRLQKVVIEKRFVRNVGVLTIANFITAGLSLIQGILVARWLGPELYGVAALVMSVPAVVYTFFDARSAEASVKYLSEFHVRGEGKRALAMCRLGYTVDLAVAVLAFLGVLATAGWAASSIVHCPETAVLILVYAAAFLPRAFVGTSNAVLATLGLFPVIALINTLTTALRVMLVLGLVLAGWGVAGVVWGKALAMASNGFLYGAAAYVLSRRAWGASWLCGDWEILKGQHRDIFRFLAYNDLSVLLGMIPKQLDVVLLGYLRSPMEVGYYKLARSLSATISYFVKPLQSVTYPELARLWGIGDVLLFHQKARKLALRVGLPLSVAILTATALIPFIQPLLVGSPYQPAVLATQLLFAGSAVWLAFFWLRPTFMALGEVRAWLCLSCVGMIILVPGMAVSTAVWGFQGLAGWLAASQLWGHSMFGAWLIWRRWSTERTDTGGRLS